MRAYIKIISCKINKIFSPKGEAKDRKILDMKDENNVRNIQALHSIMRKRTTNKALFILF